MGVSSAGPSWAHDGQILLRFVCRFDDGTTALRFELTAFLERLVALVLRPGRPMLTYHGTLALAASWRDHVVPASPPPTLAGVRGLHAVQCLFGDGDLFPLFGAGDADAPAPAQTLHLS